MQQRLTLLRNCSGGLRAKPWRRLLRA
jgi:hypothetical protein